MSNQDHELAQARELGRMKAERLDGRLREAEQRAREARLARLAWNGEGEEAELPGPEPQTAGVGAAEVWRLRQEVERLSAFHQAVLRSRAWRLIQWARRPFGRAW